MTKFDLFDSIGNVDDELIEKAIEPKKSSKKLFLAITSVAACAVFACAAVLIVQNMNKSNNVVVDRFCLCGCSDRSEYEQNQ